MSYTLGKSDFFINLLENLYGNDSLIVKLNEIKNRMRQFRSYTNPQFDDIEAEIVCLILMVLNPKTIYEFSPCGGWSTLYMLNSLDVINNTECKVHSFDINDQCSSTINKIDKFKNRWVFNLGNVEDKYATFSEEIDYLFIDSDHSEGFAKKYIEELLNPLLIKLRGVNKKIFVSVHDVFHNNFPSEEGKLVIDFLDQNKIEYFSPLYDSHKLDIQRFRDAANLDKNSVHFSATNPCIFFILG
jgi:hypothetical protein